MLALAGLGLAAVLGVLSSAQSAQADTPARAAAGSRSFVDATGDAQGNPDITNVNVSNDDAGNVHFSVEVPSHEALPSSSFMGIWIDADRDQVSDHGIWWNAARSVLQFYRFVGNESQLVSEPSLRGGFRRGLTVDISRTAFGSPTAFAFYVGTQATPQSPFWDRAPDTSRWSYDVVVGTPATSNRVAITRLSRKPLRPVAGEPFTVTASVARVGRAGRWNGTLSCSGSIGGRRIQSFGAFPSPGRAACRWDVPLSARGKLMVATITVQEGGPAVSRTVRMRVAGPRTALSAGGVRTAPAQPRAGQLFYYALSVFARSGGVEGRIRAGTVSCRATIAGRAVPVSEHKVLAREGIRCAWRIPSSAAGKRLNGTIVVRSQGATLRHTFTRRVRG